MASMTYSYSSHYAVVEEALRYSTQVEIVLPQCNNTPLQVLQSNFYLHKSINKISKSVKSKRIGIVLKDCYLYHINGFY